jgi:O-antigen/teichoic acid export membrane protein
MSVGWGLGRRCASVASMLVSTAAFPIAARLLNEGKRDEAIAQLGVNAALLLGVTLPVCAGLALIGPALVQLAVAPAYREATNAVLALAVVSGAVRCLHLHVSDQWLVLERRFHLAAWVDVIEIGACAGASVLGLALFGLRGAVGGQLLGSALALAMSVVWAVRLGFRWPWRDTAKAGVATLAMSGVLWLLPIGYTPADAGIGILVGTSTYLLAIGLGYRGLLADRIQRVIRRCRSAVVERSERR